MLCQPTVFFCPHITHNLMLLPEDGVDLQVRRPELLFDIVG